MFSGYSLGETSQKRLEGVHPALVRVVERAIQITKQDFLVLEGVRTQERQNQLYAQGRSAPGDIVTWTKTSNHFKRPDGFGHAVDLAPYPVDWGTKGTPAQRAEALKRFDVVSQAMFAAARELGVHIRWGADWDEDGRPRERGESDSPHFELAV